MGVSKEQVHVISSPRLAAAMPRIGAPHCAVEYASDADGDDNSQGIFFNLYMSMEIVLPPVSLTCKVICLRHALSLRASYKVYLLSAPGVDPRCQGMPCAWS